MLLDSATKAQEETAVLFRKLFEIKDWFLPVKSCLSKLFSLIPFLFEFQVRNFLGSNIPKTELLRLWWSQQHYTHCRQSGAPPIPNKEAAWMPLVSECYPKNKDDNQYLTGIVVRNKWQSQMKFLAQYLGI